MNRSELGAYLDKVRSARPIVHHNTNYVTANDCANVTLAVGASPIMADDPSEAAEVTSRAGALVLNMGTPSASRIRAMILSGRRANELDIPVVFDPVGVGASRFRSDSAREILRCVRCTVIRCNASEMSSLAGGREGAAGVDARRGGTDLEGTIEAAKKISGIYGCVTASTGPTDVVTDGSRTVLIRNGHQSMGMITGTGCMCDSLVASFCAAGAPGMEAAICGVACMGIAGELAFKLAGSGGTGRLRTAMIDSISNMTPEVLAELMDCAAT
ncbi:MAG: hydroxyethylthiazole kinase [Synergistaceae bacterium]|jgi:hydroxyethylthiazole kinase|nr:hydroxyethylthiazole kinase [Synergistaceae bacterium]